MIQFYINSRPTPRAIARHHLEQATQKPQNELDRIIREAISKHPAAINYLGHYGVEIGSTEG